MDKTDAVPLKTAEDQIRLPCIFRVRDHQSFNYPLTIAVI